MLPGCRARLCVGHAADGSCATERREPCQAGNRAALIGKHCAPQSACPPYDHFKGRSVYFFSERRFVCMNYQVLYRKWRPKTFDDVVGQKYITATLANEVESGNISHAYLFTGTRGTGKTTCAKILAKAVNCQNPQKGNPCNVCDSCKGIDNGSVTDVAELDAASNNSVDDIRAMIDETVYLPVNVKYRVYILDEVHMLSKAAANAFLKTLEEPPPHVIFILATTDPHKLLPTIHSRCQRFDFKRILPADIADRLQYIASKENFNLDHEAAMLIARIADGGLRDAISLLDQCAVSYKDIDVKTVGLVAGVAGKDFLFYLADCIKNRDAGRALEIINDLHTDFSDMGILCAELLEHMRALMLIKTVKDASNLIIAAAEEFKKLEAQAQNLSLPRILDAMVLLEDTGHNLAKVHNKRTGFEIAMIRLCSNDFISDDKTGGQSLKTPEFKTANPVTEAHNSVIPPQIQPVEQPKAQIQDYSAFSEEEEDIEESAPPVDENQVFMPGFDPPFAEDDEGSEFSTDTNTPVENFVGQTDGQVKPYEKWGEILSKLADCDMPLWGALQNTFAYMENGNLCLSASHISTAEGLHKSAGSSCSLLGAVSDVCGEGVKICFVKPNDPIEDLDSILNTVDKMRNNNN